MILLCYWFFDSHSKTPLIIVHKVNIIGIGEPLFTVTKNRCVTHVKIRGYANFVSSLLAYLISAVASWFSNSILSRFRMLLQIVCYCNITLFSTAGKF